MSAVQGLLDRAIDGHGAVVGVVGPPGIGKSRLVRDLSAMASARGVEVFSTFCESHTRQIPFHAIARLLRVAFGTAWRVHDHLAGDRFDELRQLCTPAGDKASLAISMAGLVMDHALQGRMREGSQLASEAWALIESVGDATLTVGLANTVIFAKLERTEYCDALRWSQAVIDLADGDRSKGNFLIGSPLALAFTTRGNARFLLGRPGWRDDLRHGLAMALSADPMSYAFAVAYVYFPGILLGVLAANERATREIEDALRIAERSTDDLAVAFARGTLGIALVHRQAAADRDRGQRILAEVGDVFLRQGDTTWASYRSSTSSWRATGNGVAIAMTGSRAFALPPTICFARDRRWRGPSSNRCPGGDTARPRRDGDVADAEAAIERLAAAPADEGLVIREIWLLRLRALLARAQGDETGYRDYRDRYRAIATSRGFEGHIAWADAMP